MQATVLKLIKQPAMMMSLLGVVLFDIDEFPTDPIMLINSNYVENCQCRKKMSRNHSPLPCYHNPCSGLR